jgi:hypothetical protein
LTFAKFPFHSFLEVVPMIRLRGLCVLGGFFILAGTALSWGAQPAVNKPDDEKWGVDRSLNLTPRAAPVPALKYPLFPIASELRDGNAVPIYLRLVHEQKDETQRLWKDKPGEWNKLPIAQLPVEEIRKFLDNHASRQLKQLELGARRKTAEWNYTFDEGDPISILLPDAQMMRVYGGLLALKARVEIAQGKYAEADQTIQTGLAFSRHVADGPFLINGLVAIAIASQMADALFDWVGQSNAPNLYWSLGTVPNPLIDLRKELDCERRMVEMQFPDLADVKRERAPAEWDAALFRIRTELKRIGGIADEGQKKTQVEAPDPATPAAQSPDLPAARKYLVETMEIAAAKVDSMPPAQVLVLYLAGMNAEYRDDLYKTAYLPAPQSIPLHKATEERLKSGPNTEGMRLLRLMLPAVIKVIVTVDRLDRKMAALRIIEAIRLYAAGHDGRLPDKLGDVAVPLPKDPGTDQPFEYSRENETATLIAPPLGLSFPKSGIRCRLTAQR